MQFVDLNELAPKATEEEVSISLVKSDSHRSRLKIIERFDFYSQMSEDTNRSSANHDNPIGFAIRHYLADSIW